MNKEKFICPKCKQEITLKKQDTSSDSKNVKQYDRLLYNCTACDIWISIEVPKE
jgi:uncharacterized protein with PIN domain